LLCDQAFLDHLLYVCTLSAILSWLIHTPLNEVEPTKEIFGPELERIKQMQIRTVSQRKLVLAILNKAVDRFVIVVDVRVRYERINPVHLQ
jgi:hypothetical protein